MKVRSIGITREGLWVGIEKLVAKEVVEERALAASNHEDGVSIQDLSIHMINDDQRFRKSEYVHSAVYHRGTFVEVEG